MTLYKITKRYTNVYTSIPKLEALKILENKLTYNINFNKK